MSRCDLLHKEGTILPVSFLGACSGLHDREKEVLIYCTEGSVVRNERSYRMELTGLLVALMFASLPGMGAAGSQLGTLEFPTSGSDAAQTHFLRGVAAMHSFEYEEALESFRAATALESGFAMGYWGEAMTHNHPVWDEQDLKAGRAALARFRNGMKVTPRERGYLDAVGRLYGQGDKPARDKAYAAAMERLYVSYPDDLEAACFYALALLGVAEHGDDAGRLRIRAGALTLEVFRRNPDHPCAAHYTIHAFDDPDHAILALPAARRYAQIAPDSHHAQHMPAHIFVQLGMWTDAAASNEAGWRDSVRWVARKGLHSAFRDYHSLHWLTYVYLQQGRYKEADKLLRLKWSHMMEPGAESVPEGLGHSWRVARRYEAMWAAFVIETEQWKAASAIKPDPSARTGDYGGGLLIFARGIGAAMLGKPDAEKHLAALRSFRETHAQGLRPHTRKRLEILQLELAATIQASEENNETAIALMKKATALEEELPPPSGPPKLIKPTHELHGEILLRAGHYEEAADQFAIALRHQPNRARSLLGAARAAQHLDHAEASRLYAKLLVAWANADSDLPELREARENSDRKAPRRM